MDRNAKILSKVKKDSFGVEIGPSYNPIAPKKDGYKVHIIDHMSSDDLKKKYTGHNVDTDNIDITDAVKAIGTDAIMHIEISANKNLRCDYTGYIMCNLESR